MLSVLIITRNEQTKIGKCLESVKFADEIILVDANSTDKTRKIASQYTSKIYTRKFDNFKNQKNFGLTKCTGDWVLAIDADEQLTSELQTEIQKTLKNPQHPTYAFPFLTHFMEHPLRHGLVYPGYHIRLFKKKDCNWQRDVHEQLFCNNQQLKLEDRQNIGRLKGDVLHYSYDSINHYFKKFLVYTDIDAKEMTKTDSDRLGRKVKVNPKSVLSILWFVTRKPHRTFVRKFFRYKGYKDGIYGLIFAIFSMFYDMVVRIKYLTRKNNTPS